jgi:hypothetical protein
LSIPNVQYALLKARSEGRFREDWTFGDVRFAPVPPPGAITPHGLDCATLENCVGGPFYPGIEVSWLIRQPDLYAGAFRLKDSGFSLGPLVFQPGFFSQQMALPWQADFYDCHKEDHTPDEGLSHCSRGELEQIQVLLGHVSVQTTERYLGMRGRAEIVKESARHIGVARLAPHDLRRTVTRD